MIEVVHGFNGATPTETASSRSRETWLREDKRKIDRVAVLFNAHQIKMLLRCARPSCPDPVIILQKDPQGGDDLVFRCGCTDRYAKSYPK